MGDQRCVAATQRSRFGAGIPNSVKRFAFRGVIDRGVWTPEARRSM
jgi:hypothetical protein